MLTEIERNFLLLPKALPSSVHYINLRTAMPRGAWTKLRAHVLARAGNKCELCGSTRPPLHAHEIYMFDFAKHTAQITNIVALCMHCHRLQHMNLFALEVDRGRANVWGTLKHYNALTRQQLSWEQLLRQVNETTKQYENVTWEVDFSPAAMEALARRLLVEYH